VCTSLPAPTDPEAVKNRKLSLKGPLNMQQLRDQYRGSNETDEPPPPKSGLPRSKAEAARILREEAEQMTLSVLPPREIRRASVSGFSEVQVNDSDSRDGVAKRALAERILGTKQLDFQTETMDSNANVDHDKQFAEEKKPVKLVTFESSSVVAALAVDNKVRQATELTAPFMKDRSVSATSVREVMKSKDRPRSSRAHQIEDGGVGNETASPGSKLPPSKEESKKILEQELATLGMIVKEDGASSPPPASPHEQPPPPKHRVSELSLSPQIHSRSPNAGRRSPSYRSRRSSEDVESLTALTTSPQLPSISSRSNPRSMSIPDGIMTGRDKPRQSVEGLLEEYEDDGSKLPASKEEAKRILEQEMVALGLKVQLMSPPVERRMPNRFASADSESSVANNAAMETTAPKSTASRFLALEDQSVDESSSSRYHSAPSPSLGDSENQDPDAYADGENPLASLVPCTKCGRRFFEHRLEKHQNLCDGGKPMLRSASRHRMHQQSSGEE
jgi:hypothetical protein